MYRKTFEKTVALGHRLDIVFALIRIGLFYMDHDLITRNIEKAKRYYYIVIREYVRVYCEKMGWDLILIANLMLTSYLSISIV